MPPSPVPLELAAVPEVTAVLLGLLGLALVGPGPSWVARWRFLVRVPRAAVVLWQAGTVAALLSLGAAGTLVARELVGLAGVRALPWWQLTLYVVVVVFTLLVVARLAWSLVSVGRSTSRRRARHRAAVDLIGQADRALAAEHSTGGTAAALRGLRVLAEPTPLAYCLPGLRGPRVVLSQGTLERLGRAELAAVLAHESAHVRSRHDLVIDTFTALHRAFPIAVRSEIPAQACALLVEMLADDAACRVTGPVPLARALVTLAGSPVPGDALAAGGDDRRGLTLRIERLGTRGPGYSRRLAVAVYALALGLLAAPGIVMLGAGLLA